MSAREEKETENPSSFEAPPVENIICSMCKWGLEVLRCTFPSSLSGFRFVVLGVLFIRQEKAN